MPVEEQLAIALYRFGHFGNSASVESVAQWAGCSAGTVVNSTRRVMQAFLSMHDDVIHYPSPADKEAAKEWVEAASCAAWRDGYLFVDGTLVPLADKPGYHGEAYFDRKSNYSLNVQLITLPNLRIVDYVIGHCGSAHDSTAFMESHTFKDRQNLIGRGEWIWADSAYPIEAWCVTPYKKPASNVPENKTFNFWVSHVRIKSEHAVGYLKGCFQSLKGLRQQIKNETDHLRAVEWIRTCIIIHTLIHGIEHHNEDMDPEEDIIAEGLSSGSSSSGSDDDRVPADIRRETAGQRKHRKVKENLFQSQLFN
ncbi:hypothetical protein CVT25_005279 [Psilocybe cyanescens]|uniref:DDE Tnp4 domain-containing protein n=1 Tax=Psilocybe cyanescens TaxID=93625 RepID=A0A409WX18_PSICY|nr:hypothetical protein CVT25_005279 [Psilocybe cyanescens]